MWVELVAVGSSDYYRQRSSHLLLLLGDGFLEWLCMNKEFQDIPLRLWELHFSIYRRSCLTCGNLQQPHVSAFVLSKYNEKKDSSSVLFSELLLFPPPPEMFKDIIVKNRPHMDKIYRPHRDKISYQKAR